MRRIMYSILLLALITCVMAGCSVKVKEEEQEVSDYQIYYLNSSQDLLKGEYYTPKETSTEGIVTELMQQITNQENSEERVRLLPEGVKMNSQTLSKDMTILTIDFNKAYSQMETQREVLVRAGIVKTLLSVSQVTGIQFTIEGTPLKNSRGEDVGLMDGDTFVEQGQDLNSYQYVSLTLYFTNREGDTLIPEKRNVYYNSYLPLEKVVMEQLLEGPREEGNYETLPEDLNLLNVVTSNDTCYVNFDQSFVEEALAVQEQIPVYSIVNSLVDVCQVKQVQFLVNGEKDVVFRESMDLKQPYEKNTELVDQVKMEEIQEEEEESVQMEQEEKPQKVEATPAVTQKPSAAPQSGKKENESSAGTAEAEKKAAEAAEEAAEKKNR